MTGVLNNIVDSMNMVVSAAYQVEGANKKAFDPTTLSAAKDKLRETQASIQALAAEQENFNNKLEKGSSVADKLRGAQASIQGAAAEQGNFNHKLEVGSDAASKLTGMLKKALITYASFRSVKAFVGLSDEMTQIKARLNSINDGQQTTVELQNMIYESAQRARGEYKTTLDIVSKLGAQAKAAFSGNKETIAFAENLNKLFTISGTSAQGMESVMYNLTQAMASGVLRGQDLNAVMANTPQLLQIVSEYMGEPIGRIRKLAEEGQLSADVIKNALLGATDDINAQFAKMPMTFGQIATSMKNKFIKNIEPALNRLNDFANSDKFKVFVDRASTAIGVLANVIVSVTEKAVNFGNFLADHWGIVEPMIWALAGAFGGLELATVALTIKTMALNTVLSENPIYLVLSLVGIAIALFARWVNSIGGVHVAYLIMVNGIKNYMASFVIHNKQQLSIIIAQWGMFKVGILRVKNGVLNALDMMKVQGLIIVENFLNGVIAGINRLIKLVNMIPGVSIDTIDKISISAGAKAQAAQDKRQREEVAQIAENKVKTDKATRDDNIKKLEIKYDKEKFVREKEITKLQTEKKKASAEKANFNQKFDIPAYAEMPDIAKDVKAGKDAAKGTKKNTEKLKDGIEVKNDDITYLKDLAEMRAIQNFSFDKIEVIANNSFGDVHETADLDGWMDNLTDNLSEAVNATMGGAIAYE